MKSKSFQINFKRVFHTIQLTTYYLKSSLIKSHSMFVKKDNFKKSINQSKELELKQFLVQKFVQRTCSFFLSIHVMHTVDFRDNLACFNFYEICFWIERLQNEITNIYSKNLFLFSKKTLEFPFIYNSINLVIRITYIRSNAFQAEEELC